MNGRTTLTLLSLLLFFSVSVATSDAATTFANSRIIAIDEGQKTITFKTKEGETWTMPVADSKLLNQQQGTGKDEVVTIEIDFNDRIINVVKSSGPATPRTDSEDR